MCTVMHVCYTGSRPDVVVREIWGTHLQLAPSTVPCHGLVDWKQQGRMVLALAGGCSTGTVPDLIVLPASSKGVGRDLEGGGSAASSVSLQVPAVVALLHWLHLSMRGLTVGDACSQALPVAKVVSVKNGGLADAAITAKSFAHMMTDMYAASTGVAFGPYGNRRVSPPLILIPTHATELVNAFVAQRPCQSWYVHRMQFSIPTHASELVCVSTFRYQLWGRSWYGHRMQVRYQLLAPSWFVCL